MPLCKPSVTDAISKTFSSKTVFLICLLFSASLCSAQVKLGANPGTINSSALLEMESSTKGLLPPRMAYAQIQAIANPANGLLVYDTDIDAYRMYKRNRWVLLTEKDKSLSDPPGEFNTVLMASGGYNSIGRAVAIAPDGSGYVVAGPGHRGAAKYWCLYELPVRLGLSGIVF